MMPGSPLTAETMGMCVGIFYSVNWGASEVPSPSRHSQKPRLPQCYPKECSSGLGHAPGSWDHSIPHTGVGVGEVGAGGLGGCARVGTEALLPAPCRLYCPEFGDV